MSTKAPDRRSYLLQIAITDGNNILKAMKEQFNNKGNNLGLLILLIAFASSCNNNSGSKNVGQFPPNSRAVDLTLVDSLGTVSFSVPLRYDTSFSWINRSDCGKPCDKQEYRFQPKALRIIKESGWIWLGEPRDSIERFTISHSSYIPFYDGDTTRRIEMHNHLKGQLAADSFSASLVHDTIEWINDRYYSIFELQKQGMPGKKILMAVTTIKRNAITFKYELVTGRNDSITNNFISNSLELLKTIRISKGQ